MTILSRSFKRSHIQSYLLILTLLLGICLPAVADAADDVSGRATGQITLRYQCGPTLLCQESTVTGQLSRVGRFTATFTDVIDLTTGQFTATGLFTTPSGSTILTEATGQALPPDADGVVLFFETHQVVGGTGRFSDAAGQLIVSGSADAQGVVSVEGAGVLSR